MSMRCLKCGHPRAEPTGTPDEACPNCGAIYAKVAAARDSGRPISARVPTKKHPVQNPSSVPLLSKVFYVLAVLGFVGGILLCVELWPYAPVGRELKSIAYMPSITWLTVGIIQCAMFSAIGLALTYLRGIYISATNA